MPAERFSDNAQSTLDPPDTGPVHGVKPTSNHSTLAL